MKISTKTITLVTLLVVSIAYNIKQYREQKKHHKEVAESTMNVLMTLRNGLDDVEKDNSLNTKEKAELISINKSVSTAFFSLGSSSILEVYDELSDYQKQIIWQVRQNIFD